MKIKQDQDLKRAREVVSTDAFDMSKTFKDGLLEVCDEVSGKKKTRRHVVVE